MLHALRTNERVQLSLRFSLAVPVVGGSHMQGTPVTAPPPGVNSEAGWDDMGHPCRYHPSPNRYAGF